MGGTGVMVDADDPRGVRSAAMTDATATGTLNEHLRAEREHRRQANLERQRRLDAALGYTPERPAPQPVKRMSAAATKKAAKGQPRPNAQTMMRSKNSWMRHSARTARRRAMKGIPE